MAVSNTSVSNLALNKLGASYITSLTDGSKNAEVCNLVFIPIRKELISEYPWSFATKRFSIAENTTAPLFDFSHAYDLPAKFLGLLEDDEGLQNLERDWVIEGSQILSNDVSPLKIRALVDVEDPNLWPAYFLNLFATRMAYEMVEDITQSNTKKQLLNADLQKAWADARRADARQKNSKKIPDPSWITVRR